MSVRLRSKRMTKRRVIKVVALGAILSFVLAQRAEALCLEQPLPRLVKTSDDVWWGTVTAAKATSPPGPGVWELTVHLDDVLKGEGAAGDTVTVYAYSCGPFITPSMAEQAAQSFVGQQQLFLVGLDHENQRVAYSEIVKVPGESRPTETDQYEAALSILGESGRGPSAGTESNREPSALAIVAPLLLALAAAIAIAAVIYVVRRRRAM